MRRLIAALAAACLVLGSTVALAGPAHADLTAPANGATLRGTVTLSDTGGYDDSTGNHCGWFGGSSGDTTIELIDSSGRVVFRRQWAGEGARSVAVDTHDHPNGRYTVRGTIGIRKNSGFLGLGCKTETRTTTRTVTIDNVTALAYAGPTSAPQNTTVTVRATLSDPHLSTSVLPHRPVRFSLSGGTSVTATTDAKGVATASLPIAGPPRAATVTASYAGTTYYRSSSATASFTVTKNATTTSIAAPAPTVHGQPTSFSAQVARLTGTGTPTGTVQFTVDGADFGAPVAVSADGVATSPSTSTLSTGSHTVGARYTGDEDFLPSSADPATQSVERAATTTELSSDVSPTVSGQAVRFTATVGVVAPGEGEPTGAVQFTVDGQPYGTAVPLDGDTASLTISNLSTGNHEVLATYNGTADLRPSSSAVLTHGVDRAETALALSTETAAAVAGEPVTFTAELSIMGEGAGTPTGTVQFAVDGEPVGDPVPVVGGTASSAATRLPAGAHLVTADYGGDQNFAGSHDSLEHVVAAAATTTRVTSAPNPSVVGQPITLRAEVTPVSPATGNPEGAVQFFVDGKAEGLYSELHDGVATLEVDDLGPGTHTVGARYLSGDPSFITSTADPVTHQVDRAATELDLESSAPRSVFGQPVTFTATVAVVAPGAGAPSGTVTFTDGSTVLGTAEISSATDFRATLTTDDLRVAQHAIVATYDGDENFLGSSRSITQRVDRAQTSTVVTSSANPAQSGQGVTFEAEVTPVAPGAGAPSGTVTFTVNGAPLGEPAEVVDGTATSTAFASLSPGTYAIRATYSGDGNFVTSSGGLDQGAGQEVTKAATEMTVVSSHAEPAPFGEPVTFTSTVTAVGPATGRPSGVVQLWDGPVLLGASNLSPAGPRSAEAEVVTTALTPGTHEIRAVYVGSFNFHGQVASTTQSVGQVPTVTGVQSSGAPSTFGDEVTLTAVVSSAVAAPEVPTGTVTFSEGSDVLGTAEIRTVQGRQQASITLSGLEGGVHLVTATYSGGGMHATSTSTAFRQEVDRAVSDLQAAPLAEQVGDGLRVRATLTGNDGHPLAGQDVVFTTTRLTGQDVVPVCDAVTDADGLASCTATKALVPILVDRGYDASFAGNGNYLPAQARGALLAPAGH
ncbi:Ig-like domain-containing protein [Nocardioides sp. SYSU DS0663]|uniref:Ig-like domain-containing protein n=1 Tax=Nocardioides sp. SYSU DS0663 TaxID=3416445 RepID=UPI003F4BBAC2